MPFLCPRTLDQRVDPRYTALKRCLEELIPGLKHLDDKGDFPIVSAIASEVL